MRKHRESRQQGAKFGLNTTKSYHWVIYLNNRDGNWINWTKTVSLSRGDKNFFAVNNCRAMEKVEKSSSVAHIENLSGVKVV